jgi:hypothetical protein
MIKTIIVTMNVYIFIILSFPALKNKIGIESTIGKKIRSESMLFINGSYDIIYNYLKDIIGCIQIF